MKPISKIISNYLWLLFLVLFSSHLTHADEPANAEQQSTLQYPRNIVSIVPQYFINNGLQLDYDLRVNKNHWIQLAPMFFFRENQTSDFDRYYNLNRMNGYGMHAYHRYYPGEGFGKSNFYISYGVVYQHYRIFYNERENGIETERFSEIDKFGGEVIIGVYTPLFETLMIDFYAGLGSRFTNTTSDAENPKLFNGTYFEYGYGGNIMVLGFRISLPF